MIFCKSQIKAQAVLDLFSLLFSFIGRRNREKYGSGIEEQLEIELHMFINTVEKAHGVVIGFRSYFVQCALLDENKIVLK